MPAFRFVQRLVILLLGLLLAGCSSDTARLELENRDLKITLANTQAQLEKYQAGLESKAQQTAQLRRDLGEAQACRLLFDFPLFCPPGQAPARTKALAVANELGVVRVEGIMFTSTLIAAAATVSTMLILLVLGCLRLIWPKVDEHEARAEVLGNLHEEKRLLEDNISQLQVYEKEITNSFQKMQDELGRYDELTSKAKAEFDSRTQMLASLNQEFAEAEKRAEKQKARLDAFKR